MSEEDIIDRVTEFFDSNQPLHNANSIGEIVSVFEKVEDFLESIELVLESDLETGDFDDVSPSIDPEQDREEVKFEIPIADTDLVLEFFYHKTTDGIYHIWLDVDFYKEWTEEDDPN